MPSNSRPFASKAAASSSSTGSVSRTISIVATRIAVGKGVVGGLRHVDVVVGMDQLVVAALAAEDLDGAVGQHLVGVHIVRGASARLIDIHHEVLVPLAVQYLVGGLDDGVGDVRVEASGVAVGERRRLLHQHRRVESSPGGHACR